MSAVDGSGLWKSCGIPVAGGLAELFRRSVRSSVRRFFTALRSGFSAVGRIKTREVLYESRRVSSSSVRLKSGSEVDWFSIFSTEYITVE